MASGSTGPEATFFHRLSDMDATHVNIGLFDIDGVFRHKRVDRAKAEKLFSEGYNFCDVLYMWDIAEETYGGGAFIDRPAFLDAASVRPWPFAEREAVCIADYRRPFGDRSARNQLLAQIEKARGMGFTVHSAFEFEFMLFDETPGSLRDKGYAGLDHFARGNRTYSLQTTALYDTLLQGFADTMERLEIGLDAIHTELGPGTFEAPLKHAEGIKAADDAALFKNFAKAHFLRHGLTAGFMSKLGEDFSGQSGHLHLSLRRTDDGSPVFADADGANRLSTTARHFIGGLTALMPEMLALCSHTVNAYKRLVPGAWAPTYASWGVQNRTVATRIINDTPEATRLEFRVPSADTNPHAALALCLAAGLWGVENAVEPPPPRDDDCYVSDPPPGAAFPRDLSEAAERLDASETARALFGDTFIDTVVFSRKAEDAAYRRHVSPWEVRRYLEVV